jgi:hypothetical protein
MTSLPAELHAQRTDVLSGHVKSDSGTVVVGAEVMVTVSPTTSTFSATTDSTGGYRVTVTNGTGEYLLYVGRAGYRPFRKRLPTATGSGEIVNNVTLISDIKKLATVKVTARHARPPRPSSDYKIGTSGMDKTVDGVTGALPPGMEGNIGAMASLVPGLTITDNGPSAFGLPGSSSANQLNGLSFAGADLPRDAATTTRFITSPWDPSRGGTAGVLSSSTLQSGGNVSFRTGHLTLGVPALQFSDATGRAYGQTSTNFRASMGGTGPIVLDKYFYNFGVQASRSVSNGLSLLDLDPNSLSRAGISVDSARKLVHILGAQGVPLTRRGLSSGSATTSASFIGRLDHAIPSSRSSWWLDLYARGAKSDRGSLTPLTPPGYTGQNTHGVVALQGLYSTSIGAHAEYANETSSALSFSTSHNSPYLSIPSGNVLLTSALADGTLGLGSIPFGGNSSSASHMRDVTWEVVNQTAFLLRGHEALPMKLYLQSRLDRFRQSPYANRLGSFTFASLDALAAGQPSSYSRTLDVPDISGGEWTTAAALGGTWTHANLQLDGGVRIDGNRFLDGPPLNGTVESLFGESTAHRPNSVALSPRLGFEWFYKAQRGVSGSGTRVTRLFRGGPELRGGIGRFRNSLSSTLLADGAASTGLPGGIQRLLCVGAAAPSPDWSAYAADQSEIPSACADGPPSLADTAPAASVIDHSYAPIDSWRGTLGWTNTVNGMYLAVDAAYALSSHLPGFTNLNFSGSPRFALSDEGNRPVYVPVSSIVPTTGSLSPADARLSSAFGPVTDRVSDLSNHTKQITVYAIPALPYSVGVLTLGYTYASGRAQLRGFDQSTGGDPRTREWSPVTYLPHHTFVVQAAHSFSDVAITAFVRATSGLPFTPMVSGDINGDGSPYNDRAYIFDPAAANASVAGGLSSLMNSGSSAARSCLRTQVGKIAAPGSCTGPWSTSMTASLIFLPSVPHTNDRAHVSLSLSNPLGGLDQLLHGANHLHGWGTQPYPDQTLYRVRAFDPTTSEFAYDVNPRFGRSDPSTTGIRVPFSVTLDVSFNLGYSPAEQVLAINMRMRPALKGTRAPADSIRKRYMRVRGDNGFMNIYGLLLSPTMADSLAISREQMEQLQQEEVVLTARADSIFGALATYLAGLPSSYDHKAALLRANQASASVWQAVYAERKFLLKVLTPGQIRRLPMPLYQMVTQENYRNRFYIMY